MAWQNPFQKSEHGANKVTLAVVVVAGVIGAYLFLKGATVGQGSFDVATVTCDNARLISEAKQLIQEASSPLFGRINVLHWGSFRQNTYYEKASLDFSRYNGMSPTQVQNEMFADRKHQCRADIVTSRGEMNMYYGWKVIGEDTYVEAQAIPKPD